MREVVVVGPRQRISIVEQTEIRGKTQRGYDLVSRLRAHLPIIVKAGPEICASAGCDLGLARNRYLLAGADRNPSNSDVAPKLPLLRPCQSFERQNRVARVPPNVTITTVQGEPRSGVEEQVDLRLVVVRRQG